MSEPPVYSGKYLGGGRGLVGEWEGKGEEGREGGGMGNGRERTYFSNGTLGSLLLKISILFKNSMMLVRRNQRELMTDSKRMSDSAIRFYALRAQSLAMTAYSD